VLEDAGATVRAYDPEGIDQARPLLPGVQFCRDPYSCADGAHALAVVTEWDEFRGLDLKRLAGLLAEPVLVDLRNLYPVAEAERAGLKLTRIGRAAPAA